MHNGEITITKCWLIYKLNKAQRNLAPTENNITTTSLWWSDHFHCFQDSVPQNSLTSFQMGHDLQPEYCLLCNPSPHIQTKTSGAQLAGDFHLIWHEYKKFLSILESSMISLLSVILVIRLSSVFRSISRRTRIWLFISHQRSATVRLEYLQHLRQTLPTEICKRLV